MSRPPKKTDDIHGGPASPRTTIVGGQPTEEAAALPIIPVGIQQLLRLASVDEGFRRQLIAKRAAAAEAAGIELRAAEAAILAAVPASQLEQMATSMPPPMPPRREFLRQTAATAAVLLGGAALGEAASACSPAQPEPAQPEPIDVPQYGQQPDLPPEPPQRPDAGTPQPILTNAGVRPDPPPPLPQYGQQPDLPPEPPPTAADAGTSRPDRIRVEAGHPPRPPRVSPSAGVRPRLTDPKPRR